MGAVDSNYHAVTLQVKSVLDSLADGVSEGNAVADDQSVQASEAMTGKPKEGRTDAVREMASSLQLSFEGCGGSLACMGADSEGGP